MSVALDALAVATAWAHIILAPYTKVEESFTLHATHDVLMYGVWPDAIPKYDHNVFPGAVPRTFIGSVLLAWLTDPLARFASRAGLITSKFDLQILIRLVLATLNVATLCMLRRATSRRFGSVTGLFFTVLTCTQFHLSFWMGRTIPNMIAMIPFNVATYLLLDPNPSRSRTRSRRRVMMSVFLLVFTAVVFRAEVALYLAPLCLQLLYRRQVTFLRLLVVGIVSSLVSIAITVGVDSYFWGYPIWPELYSIYFNVVQGKSAEWGTSPAYTYLLLYIPKLLLLSLPLSLIALCIDSRVRALLLPSLVFVALLSGLGHKEWRFVVYVVPVCNIAAGRGAAWMISKHTSNLLGKLTALVALGIPLANLVLTALITRASVTNYPGGDAMAALHRQSPAATTVKVHISNLAAQTGASLFTQLRAPPYPEYLPNLMDADWVYDKTENLTLESLLSSSPQEYTHLIVEADPAPVLQPLRPSQASDWVVVDAIQGFDAWVLDWAALKDVVRNPAKALHVGVETLKKVLYVKESTKLWILERAK